MRKVLHVGCGRNDIKALPKPFRDGSWSEIRLDINPDVIGTITDMKAVATGSISAVYSSHNLEHVFPHEVPLVLKEFRRVLGPDGLAVITCPDLQAVAKLVAEDKLMEPAYESRSGPISPIDMLYGHRRAIARGNEFMAHRGGFTLRSLLNALTSAGFAGVAGRRRPKDFELWALGAAAALDADALKETAASMSPPGPATAARAG